MLILMETEARPMGDERLGFVGIVIEELSQAPRVNQVVGQFQDCLLYTSPSPRDCS